MLALIILVFCVGFLVLVLKFRGRPDGLPKTVLLTGCGSGIGFTTTQFLLEKGDDVFGCDIQLSDQVLQLQRKYPDRLHLFKIDVSQEASVTAAAQEIEEKLQGQTRPFFGAICNIAGVLRTGPLIEMEESILFACVNVNLLGMFRVNKACFHLLKPQGGVQPRIVNLTSEVGALNLSQGLNGPYAISKIAAEAYTSALRQELQLLNVAVTSVAPGAVTTPLLLTPSFAKYLETHPNSKFAAVLKKMDKITCNFLKSRSEGGWGSPPITVAQTVFEALHAHHPQRCYRTATNWQLTLGAYVPSLLSDLVWKRLVS